MTDKTNILYIHGYGSAYDSKSPKVQALQTIGNVYGIDLDYGDGPETVRTAACDACAKYNIDLVVGCSMGGWLASYCSRPFVALNPATSPSQSLRKHAGKIVNYAVHDRTITAETASKYPDINLDSCGSILLEEGDQVFDVHTTEKALQDHYSVHIFAGGSHRFESLHEHLDIVVSTLHNCELVWGLD